ncbi:MAG TPA: DUF4442 domain-containing protein [Chitinophagales bacterium]|nr:DUF4442 domain-containing protein [Chitinophagales bacterium]HRK27245.1 DUF4442 domain-containing protein [Chitinophagales bacterium]
MSSLPISITPRMEQFIKRLTNPIAFKFFLFYKLPLAFFARLNITQLSPQSAKVTIPYGWLTQNPFKSTYFAALSMAAEMSTGVLGLMAIDNAQNPVSFLVVGLTANFSKKATDLTTFTCTDGNLFFDAVAQTLQTGEAITIQSASIGTNKAGEEVARFTVTWSVKAKKK